MDSTVAGHIFAASVFALLAAIFGAFGWWWASEGLYRGHLYGDVDELPVERFVVERVVDLREGLPQPRDYNAFGHLAGTGEPVQVAIFLSEFKALRPNDTIPVYRVRDAGVISYATDADLEESWPILRFGPVYFSWHLLAGLPFLALSAYLLVRTVLVVRALLALRA